jgi:manganese oxidase
MWFRYGIEPSAPFGHGHNASNAVSRGEGLGGLQFGFEAFSNSCCQSNSVQPSSTPTPTVGEPYTPIFQVHAHAETRVRNMLPTGVGRGSTLVLHGHGVQRDPYLAQHTVALPSFGGLHRPATTPAQYGTPSQCQGQNALGMWLGAQDSVSPMAHFDWLLASAGGAEGVPGDYLMRDIGGFGVTSGLWSLMRVSPKAVPSVVRKGLRNACQ